MDIIYADKPQTEVKCYGGPAHGRTMNLHDAATTRFEMLVEPRISPVLMVEPPPDGFASLLTLPPPIETNTYYLQTYAQEGITECRAGVFRRLRVAIVEGADLLSREMYELEDAIERVPWRWKEAPSILNQFEAWWEKALHDCGWERARVHYY